MIIGEGVAARISLGLGVSVVIKVAVGIGRGVAVGGAMVGGISVGSSAWVETFCCAGAWTQAAIPMSRKTNSVACFIP